MAVAIRLTRGGSNKRPVYRVVAADSRSPRDGKYLEIVGTFDPRAAEDQANLKLDRIEDWVQKGAQMSKTVNTLYKQAKAANA